MIKTILSHMKLAIHEGKINSVDGAFIDKLLQKIADLHSDLSILRDEKQTIDLRVKRDKTMSYLANILYKQDHADSQFIMIERGIDELNKKMAELSLDFYKKKIEDNIQATLGKKIVIQ